ncbi:hypothetical protein LRS05_03825 [Flavobacterium sp. J372]|uniref:hypothetical protein n=1 Tax=Flavobacterium sp. J372 TaxID=2898436 RepID=UPI002150CB0F|nr:hypothetical protein [Flavobacterium sp. J372]MCR5861329.1 hypothetical protein [Flavobacterium sp. J372]
MNFNLIKKFAGAVVLMLTFTINAAAQDKAVAGAKKITENMKEQLSLNESQYDKVFIINKEFLQKAIENRESSKTKVDKAKKLKELDDSRDTKLKSVLSADQVKLYVATKAENRKKLREHFQEKEE